MIISESSYSHLKRFGFSHGRGSVHMSRTMMSSELRRLLDSIPISSPSREVYIRAIEEDNCLGKRSRRTQALTKRHLVNLYALNPDITLFRALRYFWQRDPEGCPLISLLCAYARDPLLRTSAPFVLGLTDGQSFSREALEEYLEREHPGRFSKATLTSTAQNLASTWRQSGHLTGRVKKFRSGATVTAGSTAYALFLGFLTGERGETLFKTDYTRLLDCSFERSVEFAESASRKGWIVFKHVGTIMEILFPALLTKQETEWIREQS